MQEVSRRTAITTLLYEGRRMKENERDKDRQNNVNKGKSKMDKDKDNMDKKGG